MPLEKRLFSEFIGTAGLLIVVVGSGIMGESLAKGNDAIALLANSLATGAGLFALIQTFGPISGAHFNPAVSFVEYLWKRLTLLELGAYGIAQVIGGITGVWITHLMFGQDLLQLSQHDRGELRFFGSEVVATGGLILVIALSGKRNVDTTPMAIALYIVSAYWCTSSTSFANPAVTIARSLTNTFSGILWTSAPGFIVAQAIGALAAYWVAGKFTKTQLEEL
ncbi:MAG: aquaporin family protein [Bdellovibrionales bacterium]|nr:aquaporin family protein [Bdellovibrionales bacterium]